MTALENVVIGAERPGNTLTGQRDEAALDARAMSALTFVGLGPRANELISSFSYGHQRLIEIARALAANPTLLLLDEPAAGLNSTEKLELHALLKRIAAQGLTILIIDHDMTLVSEAAQHITVLNFGPSHCRRRVARGAPSSRRRLRLSWNRIMALLQINDLVVRYGEIEALRGASIGVDEGQVVTLLGANGAGKSTTLRRDFRIDQAGCPAKFCSMASRSLNRPWARGDRAARHLACAGRAAGIPRPFGEGKYHARRHRTGAPAKRRCHAKPTPCSISFPTSEALPMRWAGPCRAASCRWWRSRAA